MLLPVLQLVLLWCTDALIECQGEVTTAASSFLGALAPGGAHPVAPVAEGRSALPETGVD
jgi:hypothetical protein